MSGRGRGGGKRSGSAERPGRGRGRGGAEAAEIEPGAFPIDTGTAEILPDPWTDGAWLLKVNGVESSQLNPDQPLEMGFEYMRWAAAVMMHRIAFLKATPVFVDIDKETYNIDASKIEEKITSRTKAIIPVSIFGQTADMDAINAIAEKHGLIVIEDAAQSFGATYKGNRSCNLSTFASTSFFPAKPLGCFGDGGAVFTNDEKFAEKMKSLRLHGQTERYHHKYIGMGGRLDTLQAAILNVKMDHYQNDIERRQRVASQYMTLLKNSVKIPTILAENTSVWAQFSIRVKNRQEIILKLKEAGIPTAVHYPNPLHLQECFEYLNYKLGDFPIAETISNEILSLPMNPYMKMEEQEYITQTLKSIL